MNMLDGAQSAPTALPRAVFDTSDGRNRRRVGRNEGYAYPNLAFDSVVRTEAQTGRHEGFTPEYIGRRDYRALVSDARTMILANPPEWATEELPCVVARDEWSKDRKLKHFEARTDKQAAELCKGCPVLEKCLDAALDEERGLSAQWRFLVRGGLTPKGRANLDLGTKVPGDD